MTNGAPPVEAEGLVKRYGEIVAVDHVDLMVEPGDVYGYLGPNGAGKTTSLRMLLGLIRPTEGSAKLFGRNPLRDGARALQGVAGFVEAPRFYPYLTGRKNLELLAAFDGGEASGRVDEALEIVELVDRAKDKVGGYSHGMRQRLGIAAALLRDPRLLLLDEPTTGLDPPGMRDMRTLIGRLSERGVTVLLSSHQLAEVEEMCNRVAIIRSGRIVYEGRLSELKRTAGGGYRLRSQQRSDMGFAIGIAIPLIFVIARSLRGHGPEGILFGRYVNQSAFAIPLVILIFGSVWLFPLVTSLVAGDIFASEDHNGTLKTILTRSLDRGQIYAGKVLAAITYAVVALVLMAAVAIIAGGFESGYHSLTTLSGTKVGPWKAFGLVAASLGVYLLPMLSIAAIGLLLSTITRNSAAAVVGALMIALVMQIANIIPGIEEIRPYLLPRQFDAWQGLLRDPTDWAPIVRAAWTCAAYAIPSLFAAYLVFL